MEKHCPGCQRLELASEQAQKRAERNEKPMRGTSIVLRRPDVEGA